MGALCDADELVHVVRLLQVGGPQLAVLGAAAHVDEALRGLGQTRQGSGVRPREVPVVRDPDGVVVLQNEVGELLRVLIVERRVDDLLVRRRLEVLEDLAEIRVLDRRRLRVGHGVVDEVGQDRDVGEASPPVTK